MLEVAGLASRYGRIPALADIALHVDAGELVAIVGANLSRALFGSESPLGRTLTLAGDTYTVVGELQQRRGGFFGENGLDRQVLLPLRTAEMRYPQVRNYFIVAKAQEGMRDQALEEVRAAVRKVRRSPPGSASSASIPTATRRPPRT